MAPGGTASAYAPAAVLPDAVAALGAARASFAGIDISQPVVMGVVNVTPDSFSDGGDYFDAARAIDQALRLASEGAKIIDIGGESTRPGADPMPVADEIARVLPVIEAAVADGITVSVDTRRSAVMRAAIDAGARIINDITALADDPAALGVVAASDASVVLMHMQGSPDTMQQAPSYRLAPFDIFDWLSARIDACVAAGIPRARIAVDPGIGFGKTDEHNMEILQRAGAFHGTGCAVAIGVSRKSFIGRIAAIEDPRDRLPGTIAATMLALSRGVQIHRVHDVAAAVQAIALWNAHASGVPA
ncbi:MAG: dihydropteroate synthase [Paracoccaceae bacterium]